jgi:sodium/proline symporter
MEQRGILVAFAGYLGALLLFGVIGALRTRSLADYILGGRRLGTGVTALSAQASDMSGWLLLGLPGLAYAEGLGAIWLPLGLLLGAWCNWYFVAGPLRRQSEALGDALTLPDFFAARFHAWATPLRLVSAFFILIFFALYTASQFVAGAKLFESAFGMPYGWAVLLGAAAVLLYTLVGGFLAVSWSDALQGLLMLLALVAVAALAWGAVGGFPGAHTAMTERNPALLSPLTDADGAGKGAIGVISLMAWGLGYMGQPHILARFMAIREPSALGRARRMAIGWVTVCMVCSTAIGVLGAVHFEAGLANRERVFLELAQALLPALLAGMCLAGVLAAVMSTADSQLLVASSAVSEDLYRKALRREGVSESHLLWVGRAAVGVIAVAALWIARDPDSRVLGLVGHAWAGLGAVFGPALVFSLLGRRVDGFVVLCGMVAGGTTVLVWVLPSSVLPAVLGAAWRAIERPLGVPLQPVKPLADLYAIVPGVLAASATIGGLTWARSGSASQDAR